jgi:hypothetical protein
MSDAAMNAACKAQLAQIHQQLLQNHQQLELLMTASELQQDASVECLVLQKSAKRAHLLSVGSAPALDKDVILDTVFSYVGIKDYINVAGVSRKWRVRYLKLCYSKAARHNNTAKLSTTFKNAAMTAARLQWAFDSGLTVADLEKNLVASARALERTSLEPIAALTVARLYGLQWTAEYTQEAAIRDDVQLLQWLEKRGCPGDAKFVARCSVSHGNLDMLKCSHTAMARLPDSFKKELLWDAGMHGQLAIVQWLHGIGAAWPARFYFGTTMCWTVAAAQWALANGCTWGS